MILFSNMRFIVKFVTAVCVLFLIKLRWPKRKNFYDNDTLFKRKTKTKQRLTAHGAAQFFLKARL